MADMKMGATPTRKTGDEGVDQWNQMLRASPLYQEFMRSAGVNAQGPIKLSEEQQKAFEQFLKARGVQIPDGMHIDQAGNLNQKNTLWKNLGVGAAIGGAALTGFGLAGMGPLGGTLGIGGTAAGGAGAAGAGAVPGAVGGPTFFGAATGSGLIAPTAVGAGAAGAGIPAGLPLIGGSGMVAPPALGSKGMLAGLAGLAKSPDAIGAIGDTLSAGADTAAHNRGVQMSADADQALMRLKQDELYKSQQIAREQEGRASSTDAWKKLNAGDYVANRTEGYAPKNGLPSYGFGPKASSDVQRQGAELMRAEAMKRFEGGNPIPTIEQPTPFEFEHRDPGAFEKIANVAGPGLSIWGKLRKLF